MGVPGCNSAIVDPAKVQAYFRDDLPIARGTADNVRAFLESYGYDGCSDLLVLMLENLASTGTVKGYRRTRHGTIYTVEGYLAVPAKIEPGVLVETAWLVPNGSDVAEFLNVGRKP